MSKYHKKPVIVEAIKWKPSEMTLLDILCHFRLDKESELIKYNPYLDGFLDVASPDGITIVGSGDYIIQGVSGEFYSCRSDLFEATYESVDDHS